MKSQEQSHVSEPLGIQFMHPGREHGPDQNDPQKRSWNGGDHARKFMVAKGNVIGALDEEPSRAEFTFWGEWEPPSLVSGPLPMVRKHGPRWLHDPYMDLAAGGELQNTDPFVFGDRFRYTICLQHDKNGRPSILRRLPVGSVVLFGSSKGKQFTLDTVFVVSDEHIDWTSDTRPASLPYDDQDLYRHTTLDRLGETPPGGFRLYTGAMYAQREKYHEMFSFVPCKTVKGDAVGFARPNIQHELASGQTQGFKYLARTGEGARDLWRTTVDSVLADPQGLSLAVQIDPPRWEGMSCEPTGSSGKKRC